jgi:threonine/homoserine/homoserine lactone efflux protein
MGQGLGEILPYAVGVAISPVPIIAVILMLFSARARINGPMFMLGWMGGLAVLSSVAYAVTDAGGDSPDRTTTGVSWIKLVLGVLLLLLAVRDWRSRPASGSTPPMPKWMAGVDNLAPVKALALGALLSSVNPKNLVLTVAAAAGLVQLGLSSGDVAVSLVVFVVVASFTIAGPVIYSLVGGDRAQSRLDELKAWLMQNNTVVMAVLLLIFGFVLIGKGLSGVTA